ncbi:CBS domain-containing protein [Streptomyces kaniharaensis]|uniref:CBS domain-containing protein n=1 Tax=Streptomyces kaniharaensis TaxID=212423 RepID=A0A6N7L2Z9_9ACTN|nr:CBS domain-containing protein [Streptomyces kaniharaensis]MQS17127.1 CBS domain-containing protein [Streptomyces kaniharaensis]
MKHSILDGTAADTFPASEPDRAPGRIRVRDCMSFPQPSAGRRPHPAVAVTPGTDFATVAAVLSASRRGIVPVVSVDGTVTGVVAASDLLAAYAEEDTKGELLARDLMATPAVTVTEDTSVTEAVALVTEHSLHHLPVVDGDGRLTGLLSSHDLLDALRREDEAIRSEALALALTPGSAVFPGSLHVRCERGVVSVSGRTRTRSDAAALCLQIARIDGLTGLADHLTWDLDDTEPPSPA